MLLIVFMTKIFKFVTHFQISYKHLYRQRLARRQYCLKLSYRVKYYSTPQMLCMVLNIWVMENITFVCWELLFTYWESSSVQLFNFPNANTQMPNSPVEYIWVLRTQVWIPTSCLCCKWIPDEIVQTHAPLPGTESRVQLKLTTRQHPALIWWSTCGAVATPGSYILSTCHQNSVKNNCGSASRNDIFSSGISQQSNSFMNTALVISEKFIIVNLLIRWNWTYLMDSAGCNGWFTPRKWCLIEVAMYKVLQRKAVARVKTKRFKYSQYSIMQTILITLSKKA